MNTQINQKISTRLSELEEIYCHSKPNLNEQGIWLFLATLGCWSVSGVGYQFVAIVITFYIFTSKALPRVDGKVFLISVELYRLWRLYRMDVLSKEDRVFWRKTIFHVIFLKYSIFYDIKSSPYFYAAYLFLMATLFNLWDKI
ncbi:hypothetical protein C0W42_19700 [Photobacterium kishitanii]|uniref:hypothetical protein n=1 Tax=Photobacterium kishitanii TaxID=318456 RepID=UPI000D17913C|nr:hypothetical protein [Photobacterium kishitanii]PSU86713.1 hypothetical protein C0W42_19700 [Photobacterium kishitanii]